MKQTSLEIIQAGLLAVEPFNAVKASLSREGEQLIYHEQTYNLNAYKRVIVIGFGKAGAPMAQAIHNLIADRITAGLVIVKYGHTLPPETNLGPIKIVEAGHPVPDENSLIHTRAITDLLAGVTADDLIINLISGGGSALLCQPVEGVSLADLQNLTEALLSAGANITEINIIRKHLSQVKGGLLAKLAYPAAMLNLIISDVADDDLEAIASGPATPDSSTYADALAVINKYALTEKLPPAIINHLQQGAAGKIAETPRPGEPFFERVQNLIIANNQTAARFAVKKARQLGFNGAYLTVFLQGEAREVAKRVASLVKSVTKDDILFARPVALVAGGEPTVTMKTHGLGGRNQELALALALEIEDVPNVLVTCFATDGNDGPTDSAGAMVDGNTVARAKALGLNALDYLNQHNSYPFFAALQDHVITGPTNTNVNDLLLILAW